MGVSATRKRPKDSLNYLQKRRQFSGRHLSYVSFGSIKNFGLPILVIDGSYVKFQWANGRHNMWYVVAKLREGIFRVSFP